jgi:sterol 24-C-methyltransferase
MAAERKVADVETAAGPGIADVCQKPYDGKIRDNVAQYSEKFAKAGEREGDFDYESRTEKTIEITQSYYTLVTDFYEYGYGASFHFGPVRDGQTLQDCLLEYEHEIARNLNARPGMKILDIGCGIGGPARAIARYSGASVTGLNICHYQVNRAKELTKLCGLQDLVTFKQGDYHKMEFPNNTFDGLYALESTCYAKKPVDVYKEVHRVLKPGAMFVDSAWAMTDLYDPNNPQHVKIKGEIEVCLPHA